MDENLQYEIIYTESATSDILDKADYIAKTLKEDNLALKWYQRLREHIQKNLTVFPYMYPPYNREPWKSKGYRLMTTANDAVLYTVEDTERTVHIHAVCTRGRDINKHLSTRES